MQIAAAYVQGYVRRVNDSLHQHHKLRHHPLDLVSNIDLVAIQLNPVALKVDVALNLREIQNAGERERIVHVEMNPEHRILLSRHQLTVETQVVVIRELRRLLCPKRLCGVYNLVFVAVLVFAIFPFLFLS